MDISTHIRDIPDFPKPGIVFKDIGPLLADGKAFSELTDYLADKYGADKPDAVVGIDARGFIFGAAVASRLGCGFIPVRKKGKLPGETASEEYELEYGTDTLEIQTDVFPKGARILMVDDVLATGGTMAAAVRLVEKAGGEITHIFCLIELTFLPGREKLGDHRVDSLLKVG